MIGTIYHWLLILFLISAGLSAELVTLPRHIEFAAEEDFSAFDRQDESLRPLASRKQSARGRKTKLAYTAFLATISWPPSIIAAHYLPHFSPGTPLHPQPQPLHEVFRI
jgi:hypothetical protein